MAVSSTIHYGTQFRVAFAQQSIWGTPTATGATYYEFHVTDLVMPDFSSILSDSTKRSNGARILDVTDMFRSNAGSEYTFTVSGTLTKEILGKLVYGVAQDITSDAGISPYLKTFDLDGAPAQLTGMAPVKFFSVLVYNPAANESIQLTDCVIRTLTLTGDVGSNGGRVGFTATFVTGKMPTWDATATTTSWNLPGVNFYLVQTMATKTIGGSDAILSKYELTIENGATRVGCDSSGNAEGMSFPMWAITGSVEAKYDANTKDVFDKWFTSPTAGASDIDVVLAHATSGASQFTMTLHGVLTSPPALASAERGVFQTLSFQGVTESTTAALTVTVADGIDESWV